MAEPEANTPAGDEDRESKGYQIYVTLPGPDEDFDAEQVRNALDEFARLLTDDGKGITVDVYQGSDGDPQGWEAGKGAFHDAEQAGEGGKAGKARKTYAADEPGTPKPMYPAYICHNRT